MDKEQLLGASQPDSGQSNGLTEIRPEQSASLMQPETAPVTQPVQTEPQPVGQPAMATEQPVGAQPVPQQPATQPAQPVAKAPMDPAKKKKLGLIIGLACAGVVAVIVAIVVVVILLKVDYGETYRTAKELNDKVYDVYGSWDCVNITKSVKSKYTSIEQFNGYVSGCLNSMDGMDELVDKLGETAGVKKNSEISELYGKFKNEYDNMMGSGNSLEKNLDMYKVWHEFVVKSGDLSTYDATDAEVEAAAKVLIDSNVEVLKNYGEGWQSRALAYYHAYQNYYGLPYDNTYAERREAYNKSSSEFKTYVTENEPNITELYKVDFTGIDVLYKAYKALYEKVANTYEEHYNYGSDDCTEGFGEVYCR